MNKYVVVAICSLLLLPVCYAESGTKYVDAKLDAGKLSEANADLAQIDVEFCNKPGEKNIEYTVAPGWKQDICLEATNRSAQDIEVNIWFVDWTVTNDQRKNKACMQQWEDKNFWQYVTGYTASFIIPANNLIFQHVKIQIPKWIKGIMNWCLVYYTKSVAMGWNINFSVLMRKAKFIDIKIKPEVQSVKRKALGLLLVIWLLFLYFKKTKKLAKRK